MMEGRPIRIDRKTGDVKTISIDHPNVSVIGGIQPNTFKRALCADHFDSGLMARIILTMPPKRKRKLNRAIIEPRLKSSYSNIVKRLYSRPMAMGGDVECIKMDDDAYTCFLNSSISKHCL